jgi:hypothetical protein
LEKRRFCPEPEKEVAGGGGWCKHCIHMQINAKVIQIKNR